ncbi:MAG: hypothetical protein UAR70_01850 [Buchnera aphidicola (Chaetogeoica yunlongensis)]
MKKSTIGLLILFFWLQMKFIFGQNGLREYIRLNRELSDLKSQVSYYKSSKCILGY